MSSTPHTFDKAVENTKTLIRAAEEAGVGRIVHVSITNASEDSPLPYFRGKGLLERTIIRSKLSYAIIRPTVIFGTEGILINNIAWLLRRSPVFAVPGSGDYLIQPVFVEDVAEIAVSAGHQDANLVIDAVGPEVYTFEQMVRLVAEKVRSRAKIIHLKPGLALFLSRLVNCLVKDVLLTRDEIEGLMSNLLVSEGPPSGDQVCLGVGATLPVRRAALAKSVLQHSGPPGKKQLPGGYGWGAGCMLICRRLPPPYWWPW